ncbi:hypothetical protein [Mesorhizobium captivum]|nr:hypothetical protein [Mesorhizobium sp. VK22E]MDX8509314.1 hypothetical protein [Mesorhizobium sp. VK22E]
MRSSFANWPEAFDLAGPPLQVPAAARSARHALKKRGDADLHEFFQPEHPTAILRWKSEAINDETVWRLPMMKKIFAASVLSVALATSAAMAQSTGASASGGVSGGVSGGTSGDMSGGTTGSGTVTGTTPNPTDSTTTSSTTQSQSNGMEDRCKDSGGYDTDNNTPSGAMTSDMQNCNK